MTMLTTVMETLQEYGLPDRNRRALPPTLAAPGHDVPPVRSSDIVFVNDAYDSRKTGIRQTDVAPSEYRLYIADEFLSFMCRRMNTGYHRHFPIQLAFNFEAPLRLKTGDTASFELYFFTIPTDVAHQMVSEQGKHMSILVDPLSRLGRKLKTLFEDPASFLAFHKSVLNTVYPAIRDQLHQFETIHFVNTIIGSLTGMIAELPDYPMDSRIHQAISNCRAAGGKGLGADDLSGWTALSQSRARHLFKEETGLAFSRYLKWLKTMEALRFTCALNVNLTEAAHMAGFSDSAHLSRTFREMFGLTPSAILQ